MDRRKLLKALIDQRYGGNVAAFARAIKKSPSQVHQWLSGHRNLGDAGARHIEKTIPGLWQGYFDGDPNPNPTQGRQHEDGAQHLDDNARYLELARQIEQLPPEIRTVVMISIGRDPDEPLPKQMTESIRRMLDSLADLVRQEHNRAD